ncbi:MAG: CDP-glucose 4,6-dehydratase [Acidithiobacillus sp.]
MEAMVSSSDFWRGRKVFVTGHTGFKGGWLGLWLQNLGAQLNGFALQPPTNPSLFEVAAVERGMRSTIGDIRHAEALTHAVATAQPEIVFHLAAQPLVRYSYAQPVETFASNVMGTVHLLEAVRRTPSVRAVVIVTSDKCYENQEWPWGYREIDPMGGYDPYSSSKGCAELVVAAYRNSYFHLDRYSEHRVAIASARAGNVIGGGDWAEDRLVPDILRAASSGAAVRIRNPRAIRPWQHVLEPLSGYLLLAQRLWEKGPSFASAWNFGPSEDDAKPVSWLADCITHQWGDGAGWEMDGSEQVHEAHYLRLDCSKARTELGWHPRWGLENALDQTIAWHRDFLSGKDMRIVSLEQIHNYQEHF